MTLAFSGLFLSLAVLLAGWYGALAHASAQRTRSQIAADAAALAAVAEAGPYGRGRPEDRARDYARANGGRLIYCWCDAGAPAVQVRVAVGNVLADARAEFDATAISQHTPGSTAGLQPRMARAVHALIAASGGRVTVNSTYRSTAEQAALWIDALRRHGTAERADDWVARPGTSMHERGLAVDLGGDLSVAQELIDRLGLPLVRSLPHEPWHFELAGARS